MSILYLFNPNVEKLKANKDVDGLINALKNKDEEVRKNAVVALVKLGQRAVVTLIRTLEDSQYFLKHQYVRSYAAWALGTIGSVRAVEPLIQALKDKDVYVRINAAGALGMIGHARAIEPLIQALKDMNTDVRKNAAWALAKIGKRAVKPLVQTLGHFGLSLEASLIRPHPNDYAMWALGEIGEPAVEPLIIALRGEDKFVQRYAAEALGKIGWEPKDDIERVDYLVAKSEWDELVKVGEPAVEPLIIALENKYTRKEVAQALGKTKNKRAIKPLIQALKDEDFDVRETVREALEAIGEPAVEPLILSLRDENEYIKSYAIEALGDIGDERAVEPLIPVLRDDDYHFREGAAFALGRMGDERAVEPLSIALRDEYLDVIIAAARALGTIGETAVEPLIHALREEDDYHSHSKYIRIHAARALGNIGDKRAVEPLIFALKDDDVCDTAVEALGKIKDTRAVEPLIQVLMDENSAPGIQKEVVSVLGEIKDKSVIEHLIHVMRDSDHYVRDTAIKTLERMGWEPIDDIERAYSLVAKSEWDELVKIGELAVEPLIQVLMDENNHFFDEARVKAAEALGIIGDKRAVKPLIAVFSDEERDIRWAALDSLKKFGLSCDELPVTGWINEYKHELAFQQTFLGVSVSKEIEDTVAKQFISYGLSAKKVERVVKRFRSDPSNFSGSPPDWWD